MNLTPFSFYAVLKFLAAAKATPANFALLKDENHNKFLSIVTLGDHIAFNSQ